MDYVIILKNSKLCNFLQKFHSFVIYAVVEIMCVSIYFKLKFEDFFCLEIID